MVKLLEIFDRHTVRQRSNMCHMGNRESPWEPGKVLASPSQSSRELHARRFGSTQPFPVGLEAWRPYDIIHQI